MPAPSRSDKDHPWHSGCSGVKGAGVFVGFVMPLLNNTIVAQNMAGTQPISGFYSGTDWRIDLPIQFPQPHRRHHLLSGISNGSNGNLIGTSVDPIDAMVAAPALNGGPVVNQCSCRPAAPPSCGGRGRRGPDDERPAPVGPARRGFPRSVHIGAFQTQSTAAASTLTLSNASASNGSAHGAPTATLTSGGRHRELVDIHLERQRPRGTTTTDINGSPR